MALCRASLVILFVGVLLLNLMAVIRLFLSKEMQQETQGTLKPQLPITNCQFPIPNSQFPITNYQIFHHPK